jgi:hypothetical protein
MCHPNTLVKFSRFSIRIFLKKNLEVAGSNGLCTNWLVEQFFVIKKLATFFFFLRSCNLWSLFFWMQAFEWLWFFFWIAMWLTGYQFDPSTTSQLTSTRLKLSSNKLKKKTQMKTPSPIPCSTDRSHCWLAHLHVTWSSKGMCENGIPRSIDSGIWIFKVSKEKKKT